MAVEAPPTPAVAHAGYFFDVAERAAPQLVLGEAPRWLDELDADFHELETALRWYDDQGASGQFRRLVMAAGLFWEFRHGAVGIRWLRQAVRQEGDGSLLQAKVLWQPAHMGVYTDDIATTARRAPQALAAAEAVGDAQTSTHFLTMVSYCLALSDPARARVALAESARRCREGGDLWATGDALKMATVACLTAGDDEGLLRAAWELHELAEELGNAFFLAWCDARTSVQTGGELFTV